MKQDKPSVQFCSEIDLIWFPNHLLESASVTWFKIVLIWLNKLGRTVEIDMGNLAGLKTSSHQIKWIAKILNGMD